MKTAARRALCARGVAIAVLVALLSVVGASIARATTSSTSFDWSMPDRYSGSDGNGDGLADSFEPDGPLQIVPNGFRVDFTGSGDACSGANTTVWSIEGNGVVPGDPHVVAGDPRSCAFSYLFDKEGTYEVTLEGRDAKGKTIASATNAVRVQDFLIVSIGDSVASGEGNPDIPGNAFRWQNRQCHRSALAGPARAARAIEQADPHTSVTFVHLACSGATVPEGLLGGYEGIEPDANHTLLPPQIDELKRLAGGREIDAVLVSIGANDVQFASLVEKCFKWPACDLGVPPSAAALFGRLLPRLPGRYDQLAATLAAKPVAADRVYITQYYDPTRDDAGQPCDGTILNDHPAAKTGLFAITADEAAWASDVMLPSLNAAVAAAAGRHGWRVVGGITSQFRTHGYCAADHWVVRYRESMAAQGDKNGTLHPNAPGQASYATHIGGTVTTDLYAGGNLQSPRRPEQRLEIQGKRASDPDFLDVVGPVKPGQLVTVRARVTGPDNAGRSLAFSLLGPGSLSSTAGTTDVNGETTIWYTAPDPASADRARVAVELVDGGTTYRDTVGIGLEYADTPVPPPAGVVKVSSGGYAAVNIPQLPNGAVCRSPADATAWNGACHLEGSTSLCPLLSGTFTLSFDERLNGDLLVSVNSIGSGGVAVTGNINLCRVESLGIYTLTFDVEQPMIDLVIDATLSGISTLRVDPAQGTSPAIAVTGGLVHQQVPLTRGRWTLRIDDDLNSLQSHSGGFSLSALFAQPPA